MSLELDDGVLLVALGHGLVPVLLPLDVVGHFVDEVGVGAGPSVQVAIHHARQGGSIGHTLIGCVIQVFPARKKKE